MEINAIKILEIAISADGKVVRLRSEKGILFYATEVERIIIYDRRESLPE